MLKRKLAHTNKKSMKQNLYTHFEWQRNWIRLRTQNVEFFFALLLHHSLQWKCVQSRMWMYCKNGFDSLRETKIFSSRFVSMYKSLRSLLSMRTLFLLAKRMRIAFAWEVKCHTHIYRDTKATSLTLTTSFDAVRLDSVAVITGKCVCCCSSLWQIISESKYILVYFLFRLDS